MSMMTTFVWSCANALDEVITSDLLRFIHPVFQLALRLKGRNAEKRVNICLKRKTLKISVAALLITQAQRRLSLPKAHAANDAVARSFAAIDHRILVVSIPAGMYNRTSTPPTDPLIAYKATRKSSQR